MIQNLIKPNNLPETCQSQISKKSLIFFQSTLSPISSWICLIKEEEIVSYFCEKKGVLTIPQICPIFILQGKNSLKHVSLHT